MGTEYTPQAHTTLTILGLVILIIMVFTFRTELVFINQNREHRAQVAMSILSILAMLALTLVLLFHWVIPAIAVFMAIIILVTILIIVAPILLLLRARAFRNLALERREDKRKLIREVTEMLDDKKRERIREGKIARGEPVDE